MMTEKQKKLLILTIAAVVAVGGAYLFLKIKSAEEVPLPPAVEKTMEETLESLTAPGVGEEVSQKVLDSLTAPRTPSKTEIPQEVLDSLSAPAE